MSEGRGKKKTENSKWSGGFEKVGHVSSRKQDELADYVKKKRESL